MVLRAVTDEIMYELMRLSGQEYVDEYAQRAKGRLTQVLHHGSTGNGQVPDSDTGPVAAGAVTGRPRTGNPRTASATEPGRGGPRPRVQPPVRTSSSSARPRCASACEPSRRG